MIEEEHSNALNGCMEALESAILRVPVTGGARVINLQLTCVFCDTPGSFYFA